MALTHKQMKYCQARAEGKAYAESAEAAGYLPNGSKHTKRMCGYHMEHSGYSAEAIQARIRELQEAAERDAILKREQRQALLTSIALNENNDTPDRLRAIDQLNRMSGDYTENIRSEVAAKVELSYEDKLAIIKNAMEKES